MTNNIHNTKQQCGCFSAAIGTTCSYFLKCILGYLATQFHTSHLLLHP